MLNQLQECEDSGIPYALVIASGELESNCVKIRDVQTREETTVSRDSYIKELTRRLNSMSTVNGS